MSPGEILNAAFNLHRAGKLAEAESLYLQVLAVYPYHPDALHHQALIAYQAGRPEAVDLMRRSVAGTASAQYLTNFGVVLYAQGAFDEAAHCFTRVLAAEPDHPSAHYNLGMLQLLRRDFARGWAGYERRSETQDYLLAHPRFHHPRWTGGSLAGKTLLLHAEQGFGDVIQFARYIPWVAKREPAAKLVVLCHPESQRLLERSFSPYATVTANVPAAACDIRCALMSLAWLAQTTPETIPADVPYLKADPEKTRRWRERLAGDLGTLKIGLSWTGRRSHERDRHRSVSLSTFSPLSGLEGVSFYSLQKGEAAEQIKAVPGLRVKDYTGELHDFDDTAALVANLDLVLTVDTAVAHLAGAMGKPVWVLLAFVPDWRWQLEREDSPWYPTMRLFRQSEAGRWDDVVTRVVQALEEWRDAKSAAPTVARSPRETFRLALARYQAGNLVEAEALYKQVIAADPQHADAWNHLGVIADRLGQPGAEASMRRSIALKPDGAAYHNNLSVLLHARSRFTEEIECLQRAVALEPRYADAHLNLALVRLLLGDFARGLPGYEWRSQMADQRALQPACPQPRWQGDPLMGRRLLLLGEQGFGDTMQFLRYVPLIAAREPGAKLTVLCARELEGLVRRSFSAHGAVRRDVPLTDFDVWCPLPSLPLACGTTADTIPGLASYLVPDPEKIERWRERLGADEKTFKVGLAWAGSRTHMFDQARSLVVSELTVLSKVEGVSFHSLQKGVAAEQIKAVPGLRVKDYTGELHDFDDTAALVANLDLVLTVDTAVAHLAGAMGKPVWVLLAFVPDWRWQLEREDSPWYPTMRLFRQSEAGRWDDVVTRVVQALGETLR